MCDAMALCPYSLFLTPTPTTPQPPTNPPHPTPTPPFSVYNLADKGSTDQGRLGAALSAAMGVEVGFISWAKSLAIRVAGLDRVAAAANENHLGSWVKLLKTHRIDATPLSPYLHPVLLSDSHLCISGAAIEGLGFKYATPELTAEALRESVALAIAQGIFPPVI